MLELKMNKKKIKIAMLVLTSAIVLICLMCAIDNRDGPCLITRPLGEATKGYIGHGLANTGYFLSYPGAYQHSGKACVRWKGVTEEEYNHWVSGRLENE